MVVMLGMTTVMMVVDQAAEEGVICNGVGDGDDNVDVSVDADDDVDDDYDDDDDAVNDGDHDGDDRDDVLYMMMMTMYDV